MLEHIVTILEVLTALVVIAVVGLILYARWNYGSLEKLGIPVVPPHFFLGSAPTNYKELSHIQDEERARKYGPIYGAYEGRHPKVFVSDPELVKQILVKDYDYFSDRLPWELLHHEIPLGFLDFQLGDNWRIIRSNLTQALSIGRVKNMGNISKDVIYEYLQDMIDSTKTRTTLNPRKYTNPLIIDLSSLLFLGVRMGDSKDPNNKFINIMRSFFVDAITEPPNFLQTIGYAFPFLGKYVSPGPFSIPFFPEEVLDQFVAQVKEVLQMQRERNVKGSDFITVLLEMIERTKTPEFKKLGITENSVMSQILELYIAMYEGLPTAVSTCLYHVAKTPKAQEKLLLEIDQLLATTGQDPDREAIVTLPYLTACLSETFRIFPTFHRLDRVCTKDWTEPTRGIRITKGIPVYISLWPIHMNPEYFPNPKEFQPERFLAEEKRSQHPYAFGIFGHGPKSCPGNRLIQDLLKLTLFKILVHFRVEPTPSYNMEFYPGFGPFIRTNPILVDLVPRDGPRRSSVA